MFAVGAAELLIIVLVLLATVPGLVFQPRLALAIIALFAAPLLLGVQRAQPSATRQPMSGLMGGIDPYPGVTVGSKGPLVIAHKRSNIDRGTLRRSPCL